MIQALFELLMLSSWQLLLLGTVVWGLSRMSIKAYPNFAYCLWLVLLVKALLPLRFSLPRQALPELPISPVVSGDFIYSAASSATAGWQFSQWAAMIWLLASGLLFLRLMVQETRYRRKLQTAALLTPEVWFTDFQSRLGIKQPVGLFQSPHIQSPFMQGLWRPRIYVPERFQGWSLETRQNVLAHELMHIKRKDILVIYAQAILRILNIKQSPAGYIAGLIGCQGPQLQNQRNNFSGLGPLLDCSFNHDFDGHLFTPPHYMTLNNKK